jgi:hypothetical protein
VGHGAAGEELHAGEIIVARITSSWGKQKLAGAPVLVPKDAKSKLVDAINAALEEYKKEHAEATMPEFLSRSAHLLVSTAQGLA